MILQFQYYFRGRVATQCLPRMCFEVFVTFWRFTRQSDSKSGEKGNKRHNNGRYSGRGDDGGGGGGDRLGRRPRRFGSVSDARELPFVCSLPPFASIIMPLMYF